MTLVYIVSGLLLTISIPISEGKKTKLTEEDLLPTDETVTLLFGLSGNIENCFKNATGENYDLLLKSLYEYYNNLDDIYWMLNDKEAGIKHNATRLMARIIDYGVPIHVKEKIDYKHLGFKFSWDENAVQEVKEVVKSTKSLWENAEFLYNEFAFDEFANVTYPPDCK